METTKNPLTSKTIWGVLVMLLPTVGAWLGFDISADDASEAGVHIDTLIEAAGALLAVYGRVAAKAKIGVSG